MKLLISLLLTLSILVAYSFTGMDWRNNNTLSKENTITDFYYYKGQPCYLNLRLDKIFFKLKQPVSKAQFQELLGHYGDLFLSADYDEKEKRQIANLNQLMSESNLEVMLTNLKSSNLFEYASPVYSLAEGEGNPEMLFACEDEIIVQFKPNLSDEKMDSFIESKGLLRVKTLDLNGGKTFVLKVPVNLFSMDIANEIYLTGIANYSEPNFFGINAFQFIPNDPYFHRQWALRNLGNNVPGGVTGTPGCDMRLDSAWDITRGESYVKISIVDTGIDTLHEDLADNLVPNSQYDFYDNDPFAFDEWGHGTSVTGVAAAVGNNSLGMSGVAPECKLIAIKSGGVAGVSNTTALVNGLIYCTQIGSWISNNSWGWSISSAIDNAIQDGVTLGRNGKGIVFCFATGNSNTSPLLYPASNANVISVGGVSPCNTRKSPASCDGESWGANFGVGLDVVAPCTKIISTDNTGGPGNPWPAGGIHGFTDGDYDTVRWGTSYASPNAAGVCALMLSLDSNLTWDSVRAILNMTADKVGPYSYNAAGPLPNLGNTWNNQMGYGKINAFNALKYLHARLGPFITHTPLPTTEKVDGPFTINSVITSVNGAIDPLRTKVFWTRATSFDSILMTNSSGNNWTANIPGNGTNSLYKYYLKSTDVTGVERTLPYGAPDIYFSFTASTDSSEILLSPPNNSINLNIPVVLKWRSRQGATNYSLHVSSDSLFSNLIVNDSTLTDTLKSVSQLDTNIRYFWKVAARQNSNVLFSSTTWKFTTGDSNLLGIEVSIGIPEKFELSQNYPNPFNPVTTIVYGIPVAGNVMLKVFDMSGREVKTLINEPRKAGYYTAKFDAKGLSSGAYFYRIECGSFFAVKKMVFLK